MIALLWVWRLEQLLLMLTLVLGWAMLPAAAIGWLDTGSSARVGRAWLWGAGGLLVASLVVALAWNGGLGTLVTGDTVHSTGPTCFDRSFGSPAGPRICVPRSVSWLMTGTTLSLLVHHGLALFAWCFVGAVRGRPVLDLVASVVVLGIASAALIAVGWVYLPSDSGLFPPFARSWGAGLRGAGIGIFGALGAGIGGLAALVGWIVLASRGGLQPPPPL